MQLAHETNELAHLILRIDAWQEKTGIMDYRLGLHACANGKALDQVRAGNPAYIYVKQLKAYLDAFPDGPPQADDGDKRRTWALKGKHKAVRRVR